MTLNRRGLNKYDLILGGVEVTAQFPLHKFLNLEHRKNGSDDAEVVMKFKLTALTLKPNKSVTAWQPISAIPGIHVTDGAMVDWDTNQVLVMFRLRASNYEEDSTPVLMLEALLLDSGTWEGVPQTKKKTMSGDGSLAILLWAAECAWYSPLPQHKLPTAPGILRLTMDVLPPSEFRYH